MSGSKESIEGRIILNLWLAFKEEFKLKNYRLENLSAQVLHRSLIEFSQQTLNCFLQEGRFHLIAEYMFTRIDVCEELLIMTDHINMITEFSRLYGISARNISRGFSKKYAVQNRSLYDSCI